MRQRTHLPAAVFLMLTGLVGIRASAAEKAAVMDGKIRQAVARHQSEILELRYQTHQSTELGKRETKTTKLA